MKPPKINFIQNPFFEVFVIHRPVFGQIALGYFSPFKFLTTIPPELANLLTTSAVIAGDTNSTPTAIQRVLSQLNLSARISKLPTYLFSKPDPSGFSILPSFDNFVFLDPTINFTITPLIKLPTSVSYNPRNLITELNLPSDHVPVICQLSIGNSQLKIGIFNIADPVFWSKHFPATGDGFDLSPAGESRRLALAQGFIIQLFSTCDLVCLQEIPVSLVDWLTDQVAQTGRTLRLEKMCSSDTTSPDISRLALVIPT